VPKADSSSRTVVLLGGGGHASDVLSAIESLNESGETLQVLGFVDDGQPDMRQWRRRGLEFLGPTCRLSDIAFDAYVAAVGYPLERMGIVRSVPASARAISIVHPNSVMAKYVGLGDGNVVLGLAQISAGVTTGDHCLLSYCSMVGHDTMVGRFVSVMPGAAIGGRVTIGDYALIGANATVLEGLHIGAHARVGAGAVVTRDVAPGSTVVGVPAAPRGSQEGRRS
jgi:sugar O-acyltransferase (sialic acid O-acetyltransferase NeuD family)